jgi:threonine dehydrogenase-like Zn-dependent dehydrogenase
MVAKGLTIGHEPVGVIEKLGSAVKSYREGQRVIAGAITPSGYSEACLCGCHSQDGAGTRHGWKPMGGWRFGNTIDGAQAEYVLVPDAMTNLAGVSAEPGRSGEGARNKIRAEAVTDGDTFETPANLGSARRHKLCYGTC